jgi:hypothetical protein
MNSHVGFWRRARFVVLPLVGIIVLGLALRQTGYLGLETSSDFGASEVRLAPRVSTQQQPATAESGFSEAASQGLAPLPLVSASPVTMLDSVTSASVVHDELLRRANAGETSAMVALMKLVDRCSPFWSEHDKVHPRHELDNASIDPRQQGSRVIALELMKNYCDRPYAPGEAASLRQSMRERLASNAEKGDLVARASRLFEGATQVDLLDAYASAEEPWVSDVALNILLSTQNSFARDLAVDVFGRHPSMPQLQRGAIIAAAARWHACDMGTPCGANQNWELGSCLYQGNCGIGMDVRTFIRQRELSGYEFDLMQRYLAVLNERLRSLGAGRG